MGRLSPAWQTNFTIGTHEHNPQRLTSARNPGLDARGTSFFKGNSE